MGSRKNEFLERQFPFDWRAICGMRDVLIHNYIGVDTEEVWNVASMRIPELVLALRKYLLRPVLPE
ncbi:MAG: DUF86 domain-containing protein [Bryobacterales bacterium]|nr:DUF86 domain-containing protein [Bryobacterales bacterium]